jgi:hypothetical protein
VSEASEASIVFEAIVLFDGRVRATSPAKPVRVRRCSGSLVWARVPLSISGS